jgi:DNA-binding NtrC family response regulator
LFSVLVVEGQSNITSQIENCFGSRVEISSVRSIDYILDKFAEEFYDVLIWETDIAKKNKDNGIELLQVISTDSPKTQILIIAPEKDSDLAIESIAAGAFQYLISPINEAELISLIEVSMDKQPQVGHNLLLETENLTGLHGICGISQQMREVYKQVNDTAYSDISVMLTGETGTGKDLIAGAIHKCSQRKNCPYIIVNIGAMSPELVSSTLFGHVKGAFTGATHLKKGRFEEADSGTIFLDEIGTMDEKTQISLLRLLENQSFYRTGGKDKVKVDVRVIAATNESLFERVSEGTFREDLYYRLDVFRINIPPLRKRFGDIAYLTDHFVSYFCNKYNKVVLDIDGSTRKILENYEWPGNVRELKNSIQRAVLLSRTESLTPDLLPARFVENQTANASNRFKEGLTLAELEKEYIRFSLHLHKSKIGLAKFLGISRKALYNKIKKYNL